MDQETERHKVHGLGSTNIYWEFTVSNHMLDMRISEIEERLGAQGVEGRGRGRGQGGRQKHTKLWLHYRNMAGAAPKLLGCGQGEPGAVSERRWCRAEYCWWVKVCLSKSSGNSRPKRYRLQALKCESPREVKWPGKGVLWVYCYRAKFLDIQASWSDWVSG